MNPNLSRRHFLYLSCAAALAMLASGCDAASAGTAGSFIASKSGDGLAYWLYTPPQTDTPKPLLLYLHGGSGKGSDLTQITTAESLPRYLQQGDMLPDAYIVIPQLPASCKGWTDIDGSIMSLLAELRQKFAVCGVGMTGHSMGGTGTWALALAHPQEFAAIAPLSGSVETTPQNVQALAHLPVWAVVGSADTIVNPESSIQFVTALKQVNADAHLTILSGASHFDVPQVYLSSDPDLLGWLTTRCRQA